MKNLLINRAFAAKKKKIFTLLLAVAASVGTIFAKKVQIGDLYYNLDATNQTAEVTYKSCKDYYQYNADWTITTANIPASVTYGGKTYTVTSIGYHAFQYCSALTSVTIPNSVTSIGYEAFSDCSGLTSVTIGNSVTSIGSYAFYECSGLTSVTIPNSVTSIGKYAFEYCTSLTSVTIGNSVTSIGDYAFYGCKSLTSPVYNAHVFAFMPTSYSGAYTIPNGIESIAGYAFYGCSSLTSVTIPNSVTSIGDYAFHDCTGLTSVTIPNSVTSIGNDAFMSCKNLTSVTIGNSVTSIGDRAFYCCSGLTFVTIGNSVTSIGDYAFGCTGLTSVTIGNSVTSIGDCAFWGCTSLTSVTIGNSVTSIGDYAFYSCSGLTSVTIEAETPPVLSNIPVFDDTNNYPIYVPCNAVNTYKTASAWRRYADRIYGNCASSYTVRFLNWDGSVLQSTQVEKGKMPQYTGTTPTKPSDSQYSYTFSGWTPQIVAATADATYTATFAATKTPPQPTYYTIKFKNWDGSVLQSMQVEEGQIPQYTGATPTKPDDAQYTYTFSGWTPQIVAATADATYTATFTATPKGQGIDDVQSDPTQCTKVIRDGQLFILRGDKTYTLQGQETIMP